MTDGFSFFAPAPPRISFFIRNIFRCFYKFIERKQRLISQLPDFQIDNFVEFYIFDDDSSGNETVDAWCFALPPEFRGITASFGLS